MDFVLSMIFWILPTPTTREACYNREMGKIVRGTLAAIGISILSALVIGFFVFWAVTMTAKPEIIPHETFAQAQRDVPTIRDTKPNEIPSRLLTTEEATGRIQVGMERTAVEWKLGDVYALDIIESNNDLVTSRMIYYCADGDIIVTIQYHPPVSPSNNYRVIDIQTCKD